MIKGLRRGQAVLLQVPCSVLTFTRHVQRKNGQNAPQTTRQNGCVAGTVMFPSRTFVATRRDLLYAYASGHLTFTQIQSPYFENTTSKLLPLAIQKRKTSFLPCCRCVGVFFSARRVVHQHGRDTSVDVEMCLTQIYQCLDQKPKDTESRAIKDDNMHVQKLPHEMSPCSYVFQTRWYHGPVP